MTAAAWVAERGEAAHVARLMIGFRDHLGRDHPPADEWLRGVERLLSADPNTEFLLAGDAGHPAGVCQVRFRFGLWYAATDAWIEDVFVEDAARGGGLGRALIALAIERARERGCARVQLDVNERNSPAWRLYERAGFEVPPAGERDVLARLRL